MSKRALAREETRRRIVEATAKLHGENGVLGTSWQAIAKEADVSVATVYAHFPSLDELLPACGALVMERVRPPRARVGERDHRRRATASRSAWSGSPMSCTASTNEAARTSRSTCVSASSPACASGRPICSTRSRHSFGRPSAPKRANARTVQLVGALLRPLHLQVISQSRSGPRTAARTVARVAAALVNDAERPRQSTSERSDEAENESSAGTEPGRSCRERRGGTLVVRQPRRDQAHGGAHGRADVDRGDHRARLARKLPSTCITSRTRAFWVLEGDVTFEVGDTTFDASAGDFAFGPRDVPTVTRSETPDAGCSSSSRPAASRARSRT